MLLENGADANLVIDKFVFGTPLLAAVAGERTRGQTNPYGLEFCYPTLLAAGADLDMAAFGYFLAKSINPMESSIDQLGSAIDKDVESGNVVRDSLLAEFVCSL